MQCGTPSCKGISQPMQSGAPAVVNVPAYAESGNPIRKDVPAYAESGAPAVNEVPVYGESGPSPANVPVYAESGARQATIPAYAERLNLQMSSRIHWQCSPFGYKKPHSWNWTRSYLQSACSNRWATPSKYRKPRCFSSRMLDLLVPSGLVTICKRDKLNK